jgi:hypothetical protein
MINYRCSFFNLLVRTKNLGVFCHHPNVTFQQFIHTKILNAHEIACSEWPRLTVETIAIHLLSTALLMGPHGKKMQIAKDLGVYYGSYNHYSSKVHYIWFDHSGNSSSMVMNFQNQGWGNYHIGKLMNWFITALIALVK